jgi:hypothetical protein
MFLQGVFLIRSVHFNICQIVYLVSPQKKLVLPNLTTGLRYHTKEADQLKMELTKKPNTPNKANTSSTKLLLPTATLDKSMPPKRKIE